MSDSVSVPRALWIRALADAIDWTESLIESQGKAPNPDDVRILARYRQAYDKVTGSKRGPITAALDNARPVTITELMHNDQVIYPGSDVTPLLARHGGRMIDARENGQ